MSKQDNSNELNKKRNKRLKKLALDWPESCWPKKLTLPDLRLLLESFPPLQELIRDIAKNNTIQIADMTNKSNKELDDLQKRLDEAENLQCKTKEELDRSYDECRKIQQDLEECTSSANTLLNTKQDLEKEQKKHKNEIKNIQAKLNSCQNELNYFNRFFVEVDLLRQDKELAKNLQLDELYDNNQEALIQVVAVLAQRDNLERLWKVLCERCEAQDRAASDSEQALLRSAVMWYNYNWRTLPYQLIEVAPSTPYDFEKQQRLRKTPTGDIVENQQLPGIADSSGKPICKTLVSTR